MRKTMKVFFFALFAAALAPNVCAQEENREKRVVLSAIGVPGISTIGGTGITAIKNAPFSGELVSECTQTLADGNHISQRTSVMIYRDKEGRIRRETSLKVRDGNSGEYKEYKTIQISDYFGGENFTLDPQNRTATKSVSIVPAQRDIPPGIIKGISTLRDNTGAPASYAVSAAVSNLVPFAPGAACGPGVIRSALLPGANAEIKNESLESQMIEGVAAVGLRITQTIPAGAMGNERPIEITYERWRSNELQMDVLIKSIDPRSGESTQRMTNINLGEPDASLFEIPPDYAVRSFERPPQLNLLRERMSGTAVISDHQPGPQAMDASLKPTILYREKAKYTEEARQNRVEGVVVLSVVFNVNGLITEISVVRGLPYGLTEKAIEAAKKIRFQPAVKDGTPVSVRGNLEFFFELDK